MSNRRIIAFYLPQYHETETNNKWYGEGFTEWTNVKKAQPLFKGHYQPIIPGELGYYSLLDAETRDKQALLAKEAGLEGFCYYHYWFGKGRTELEKPFQEVVTLGEPDFPFCLCWANQSWYSKFWNNDIECEQKLIVEQEYDNEEWREKHFYSLLNAFKDKRYIKVNGKLLFMIYRPLEYPDVKLFMEHWNRLAQKEGLIGFYFAGQANNDQEAISIKELGFEGVNIVRKNEYRNKWIYSNIFAKYYYKFQRFIGKAPYHYDYNKIYSSFVNKKGIECQKGFFPTLLPNWDHSPRSGKRGDVFYNSTPENFDKHLKDVLQVTEMKDGDDNIIFLKSWNEWGEGNYIEPCTKYGRGYINVLKRNLS